MFFIFGFETKGELIDSVVLSLCSKMQCLHLAEEFIIYKGKYWKSNII